MSEWALEAGKEMVFETVYKMRNATTGETREMYRAAVPGGFIYITASQSGKDRSESSFFVPAK